MSDPLADELGITMRRVHEQCRDQPFDLIDVPEDVAYGLRNSEHRLAIAASLLTEEDVARAIARHDHAIGWDRMCTGDDCGSLILAALRGESR